MTDTSCTDAIAAGKAMRRDQPSLVALGFWIRGSFIGASLFVAGLVSLFGEGTTVTMLGLAGIGIALAFVAVTRTQEMLRELGGPSAG